MNISKGTDVILSRFLANEPFTIGKMGANELNILMCYHLEEAGINNDFLKHKSIFLKNMYETAGIYPRDENITKKFMSKYVSYLCDLDICAIWNYNRQFESDFMKQQNPNFTPIELRDIEPFYWDIPWSRFLEGKRVLVISCFADLIVEQMNGENRTKIWKDKNVLPKCDIIPMKIRNIYYTVSEEEHKSYPSTSLELLDEYIQKMKGVDFDVVLVGAGVYSIPLIVEAKRMGKIGIHLGGGIQIMFGIMGSRWTDNKTVLENKNESWIRPEKPVNCKIAEGGCYW